MLFQFIGNPVVQTFSVVRVVAVSDDYFLTVFEFKAANSALSIIESIFVNSHLFHISRQFFISCFNQFSWWIIDIRCKYDFFLVLTKQKLFLCVFNVFKNTHDRLVFLLEVCPVCLSTFWAILFMLKVLKYLFFRSIFFNLLFICFHLGCCGILDS